MPEFAADVSRQKGGRWFTAVATSYRDRSHFDGQDTLESGFAGPEPGLAIRLAQPRRAGSAAEGRAGDERSLPSRPTTPLVLRGAAPTVGWALGGDCRRRAMTTPRCGWSSSIAIAIPAPGLRPVARAAASRKTALSDDMKPKPGNNNIRRDAAGGARRRRS